MADLSAPSEVRDDLGFLFRLGDREKVKRSLRGSLRILIVARQNLIRDHESCRREYDLNWASEGVTLWYSRRDEEELELAEHHNEGTSCESIS